MRKLLPRLALLVVPLFCPPAAVGADEGVPPELLQAIKDKDPETRVKAVKSLSKLGVAAVPPLAGALADEEAEVSQAAAYALRLLRAEPAALLKALRPLLADKDPKVRQGVAGALGRCGPEALPVLATPLGDPEAGVRRQAVFALQDIVKKAPKAGPDVLPLLAGRLADESVPVRLLVAQTLPRCGKPALETLLKALADSDAKVRAYALAGLPPLKPEPAAVLPAVVKRLREDPELIVRQSAVRTLGLLGPAALEPLSEALRDRDPTIQNGALKALAKLGPRAKVALTSMKELAGKSPVPAIRREAVQALAEVGPEGTAAVVDLLGAPDSATRLVCLQCLGRQESPPRGAVARLVAALADEDAQVRLLAAHVLGQVGPEAREAVPALTRAADDPDKGVRAAAARALEKIKGR
jgi:HEAT repeat protein